MIMGLIQIQFDDGERKKESLRELDTADDGERNEAVEEGQESGGAKEEDGGGSGEASGGDLRLGEVGRFGDGGGSDGFHGLDGHGEACGDVERCED
ncbi:hypothetical protein LWI29_005935 [Acer saccharum]|uniref:Uncharacterized protein n=1 Tax=Acer saccharum TaxID=4024 RepID=A0AA39STZ2_ACESA|nr:hypothetical protein LWI29_005935 [Acer saccharum]